MGNSNRRAFLIRSLKATFAVALSCATGYVFYDRTGPEALSGQDGDALLLPDYSVRAGRDRICIVRGGDRKDKLNRGLQALGGIESFVGRGDRVLLKVNAAFAAPPALAATTHPLLVAEMARLCFAAGAADVLVADNPINAPESCFMLSGIGEAARRAGASVVLPGAAKFRPVTVPGGKLIRGWPLFYEPLRKIDKIIGLAPVKDHHRSGASMTIKNWYGLLGGRRNVFHQDIHNIIKELAMMIRPTLVILDGTATMMSNGPTGGSLSDLKKTDTLIIGTDQVAVDAFGATLLGKTAADLPHLAMAEARGAGTVDYDSLNPIVL